MKDNNLVRKIAEKEEEINGGGDVVSSKYNLCFLFLGFGFLLFVLLLSVFRLQVFEGEGMYARSQRNQIDIIEVQPRRGIIFDRNGEKLVENVSSIDCYINLELFYDEGDVLNNERLENVLEKLSDILGENSFLERVNIVMDEDPETRRVLLASNLENEAVIDVRASKDDLVGIELEEALSRNYLYKEPFAHVLGYTGIVSVQDLEDFDYVGFNDLVGKSGLERYYDSNLFGEKGELAVEVDAFGRVVSRSEALLKEPVSGESLHSTLDLGAQKEAYDLLADGIEEYGALSGSIVVQDVETGEILVMASYPSYDNNLFVGGITQKDYEKILSTDGNPMTNKAVDAQVPPGSMLKTLVAVAGLDAGVVEKDTIYVSRAGYSFSSGVPFPEFQNNVYGPLNLVDALMLSSNIYFCEMIRGWDMNELEPYLKSFGIGKATGIDLSSEGIGRIPSPEIKVKLARTSSPWLEPYWYPEGDSCNAVIGQGIITVTPLQAVNWASAIANGGVLNTPRLIKGFDVEEIGRGFVSEDALEVVREGMRASVAGERRVIVPLTDAKTEVAAKTGTAEFGKLGEDGRYEHTHAWVNGFFPYDDPKYSFVVFLEDGGASNNAARVAREMVDWIVENVL